jgi:hypothetical protein
MNCHRCISDPTYHSFEFISRNPQGDGIYYTCPSKGKLRAMKDDSIPDFVAHMDSASIGAWIWIIDCSGLESFHMPSITVLRKFLSIIQDRYKYVLKHVYIMNTNWKMNMILSMIKPFMKDEAKERLTIIQSKLQFIDLGINVNTIKSFNK